MADENEQESLEETEAEASETEEETSEESAEESDFDGAEDEEDEESEDEGPADDAEARKAIAAAATAAVRRKKKTGRKKRAPRETAGERLKRAKDAKAAKKSAERGREAEVVEEQAIEQAEVAASFLEKHQKTIIGGMVGVAVIAAAGFIYQKVTASSAAEVSQSMWAAVETASAPIIAEEDRAEDDDSESYETLVARAEAARDAFQGVQRDYAGSNAIAYAALGEANALYNAGEFTGAREAYERALGEGGHADVTVRALEGIAFTHEAEDNWNEAKARYEELRDVDDNEEAGPLARYHLARVALHEGDEEAAKESLRTVLADLREEDAPDLPYVRDQAELRLMAIDSSLVDRAPSMGGGLGGGGMENLPEELRRQIEAMQRQQQGQQ